MGGAASVLLGLLLFVFGWVLCQVPANYFISPAILGGLICNLFEMGGGLIDFACLLFLASYLLYKFTPDNERIRHMVYCGLCCPAYGNPLRLKDGEFLPRVTCVISNAGHYTVTVTGASLAMEEISKSAS